jgi:3-dehydroquinate dehydratase
MDLAGIATSLTQSQLKSQVQIRVEKMALDAQSQQGDASSQLIDDVDASFNNSSNSLIAISQQLGGQLDVAG